jgi:hypothetical protein
MKIVATFFEKIAVAGMFLLIGHRRMADKFLSAEFE